MCKHWMRCSREVRSLTNELNQVRGELQISSMVRCGSDHPDEFIVPLDHPNEEITEQWQDGLHDLYTCRSDQCSVKSARISSGVSQKRSSSNFSSCLKRPSVSVSTNSQISTPCESDPHSASRGPVVVPPQKPSAVTWFQRCFRVSHLFGAPSPRKVDSTNGVHIPGIFRCVSLRAGGGSGVLLGPRGACCSCGRRTSDNFSVGGHFSCGSIAQSRQCGLGTARWTRDESGGSVYSCQRSRMQSTSCATEQTCQSVGSNKVASKI